MGKINIEYFVELEDGVHFWAFSLHRQGKYNEKIYMT